MKRRWGLFGLLVCALAIGGVLLREPANLRSEAESHSSATTREAARIDAPIEAIVTTPYPQDGGEPAATALPARGRLVLRFRDHRGRAVPGIVARAAAETRTADAAGECRWELAPGRWRWRLESDVHAEIVPSPDVFLPTRREDGAVGWEQRTADAAWSGPFRVEAGKETRFEVLVHRGTAIVGILPITERIPSWQTTRRRRSWHAIRLFRLRTLQHPEDPNERLHRIDQVQPAVHIEAGGSFRFDDVPPGPCIVEAWWRDRDHYGLYREPHLLLPGRVLDLGLLRPRPTRRALELTIGETPEAAPGPKGGSGGEAPFAARVRLGIDPAPEDPERHYAMLFDVAPGRFVLEGLPPRCNVAEVIQAPDGPPGIAIGAPVVSVTASKIALHFPRGTQRTRPPILLRGPAAQPLFFTLEKEGRTAARGILQGRARVSIAPGRYRLFVHSERASRAARPVNLLFDETVELRPDESFRVTPHEGMTYAGQALDRDGTAAAEVVLAFRPPGLKDWAITTRTDGAGRFSLAGMPARLQALGATGELRPGSDLILRLRRPIGNAAPDRRR